MTATNRTITFGASPDIHTCSVLYNENEELQRKLAVLKKKYLQLLTECEQYKICEREAQLLRDKVTTRCTYVQTEYLKPTTFTPIPRRVPSKPEPSTDPGEDSKLIGMHNQLMKRYERELRKNVEAIELVTKLQLGLGEQEKRVHVMSGEKEESQREIRSLKAQLAESKAGNHERKVRNMELDKAKRQVASLRKENDRMKLELRGLDPTFFEEVEDLKFALQESTRLNKEYEKSLCKLCKRYGVPYPYKETS